MSTTSIENKVVKKEVEGKIVYCPVFCLNGEEHLICHQGNVISYDTEEAALEYFNDEEE